MLRYSLKEESLKLEIKLILNLAILTIGLLVSSSVADYNTSSARTTVEWTGLIALICISFVLAAAGLWLQKVNFKNPLKKYL